VAYANALVIFVLDIRRLRPRGRGIGLPEAFEKTLFFKATRQARLEDQEAEVQANKLILCHIPPHLF